MLAIAEATGRFVGEIERDMEADELELWAEHFTARKRGGAIPDGMNLAQLTARLKGGGLAEA